MADDGNPIDPINTIDISSATAAMDAIKKQAEDINSAAGNLSNAASNHVKVTKLLQQAAENGMDPTQVKQIAALLEKVGAKGKSAGSSLADSFFGATGALDMFKEKFKKTFNIAQDMNKFKKDLVNAADAGGAIFLAKGFEELTNKIDQASQAATGLKIIDDIQKPLYETRREALQFGMGLGESFEEAKKGMAGFRAAMAESQVNTRTTREELRKVQGALRDAFKPKEMNDNLDSLVGSNKNFQSALTVTNTALLASKAMGMDSAEAAGMLAKAHLELGESAKTAPKIFAQIAHAAENSDLGYRKVASSIMKSADALKMWGGTIGSVTPIFNAFSRSLKGTGREGLTPDLVEKYASGLSGMSFGMKSLIGMGGAGGGGRTAIGAGLRTERLLGEGESGMAELSKDLIATLKRLSGGKMLTAKEAEGTPMEAQYMIQRKLLQENLSLNAATADMMMGALKEVDEGGMEVGKDMSKRLNDIAKAGEDTAQETTDVKMDALIGTQSTIISNGDKMVDLLAKMVGGNKLARKIQKERRKMARGEVGAAGAISGLADGMGVKEIYNELVDGVLRMTGNITSTKEEKKEVLKGQAEGSKVAGEYFKAIAVMRKATVTGQEGGFAKVGKQARQKIATGRDIQTRLVKPELKEMLEGFNAEIKALRGKDNKSSADSSKILTMERERDRLSAAMKQKRINLSDFGAASPADDKPQSKREKRDAALEEYRGRLDQRMKSERESYRPQIPAEQSRKRNEVTMAGEVVSAAQSQKETLPINEAQDATAGAQKKRTEFDLKSKTIELEIKSSIVPVGDGTFRVEHEYNDTLKNYIVATINEGDL